MRNLLGRLHDRPPRSLADIARHWEIELRGRDPHSDAGHLYRTLSNPWVFAIGWEALGAPERRLLQVMARQDLALAIDDIRDALAGSKLEQRELSELVGELYRSGYLYNEQDEESHDDLSPARYFLPREFAHLIARLDAERERGDRSAASLEELLASLGDAELADMAEYLGYHLVPALAGRTDLVAFVLPRLVDPDVIRDAVRSLDPTAMRLWRWLEQAPEPPAPASVRQALRLSGPQLRRAIAALSQRGLVWRTYAGDGSLRLLVPGPVRHPRRKPEPPPPDLQMVESTGIEPTAWMFPYAAAWDLLTILRAVSRGVLGWKHGEIDARSPAIRRVAAMLWRNNGDVPPTGYVPFLGTLAKHLGLLEPDGGGVRSDRVREWTRFDYAEQSTRLVELWRADEDWPEAASRETLQILGANWPAFRQQLLETLATLEPGRWVTVESFAERFAATRPNALGARFAAAARREQQAESPVARRRAVIKQATELTLTTAGVWLGLIELARQRRETIMRLAEFGKWHLRAGPLPAVPFGEPAVQLEPDFLVRLLQPSPRRVWALSAFSDVAALSAESVYRLTRQSVERGLRAGLTIEQMMDFLARQSGQPLPEPVAFALGNWARQFRRADVRPALVVEIEDPALAAAIAAAAEADGLRVERLPGERLLIGPAEGEDLDGTRERIRRILRDHGHVDVEPAGSME